MTPAAPRRHRALRDVAIGIAAAVLAFVAVPGVLAGFVGIPLPTHWSRHAVLSLHGLFDLLAIVAWIAWASCAWPLLRSVVVRVRARDAAAAGPVALLLGDRLALRIAAAVLAVAPVGVAGAANAGASNLAVTAAAPASAMAPSHGAGGVQGATVTASAPISRAPSPSPASATVAEGDTLWTVAERVYEDGGAWPAIAAENLGRLMDDGTRFVDPSVLRPGWTLVVPPLEPVSTSEATVPADVLTAAVDRLTPQRGHGRDGAPAVGHPRRSGDPGFPAGLLLPELAILGTGALVAALLARRSRQARRLRSFVRPEGATSRRPSEEAADLGRAIGSFEHVPLLQWVELAIRLIGSSPVPYGDGVPLPRPQLLRAGGDGVEVRFASPPPPPAGPWVGGDGNAWLLPTAVDLEALGAEARRHRPWSPLLVPLGEDDRGSWLLPLTAGMCLSIIGPAARHLARAMIAGAEGWTWREELVVTGDPHAAGKAAGALERRPDGSLFPRVLFTGDPRALAPTARRRCAVLAVAPVATADVSVIVDQRAATVHPLGLTVRPHLLDRAWSDSMAEVGAFDPSDRDADELHGGQNGRHPDGPVDGPPGGSVDGPPDIPPTVPAFHQRPAPAATVRVSEHPRPQAEEDAARAPVGPGWRGAADVRLLVPLPFVEGLSEELAPKRARRATELLAYLALHAPQPVTGDRLRTRVLGTADSDAASKTLFNTVGAARRALGAGPDGLPLLPAASRSGQYSLSPLVSVDALRCVELVRAGRAAPDPRERVALLTAALDLVGGEPLSGVLTGYGWWQAEGHERRVADAVVDGTCALVRVAAEARHLDLGRWALEKARLVEPYSEALTRAAMALAAAAGDGRRLHLEWQECCRQADELDPGATPSEATERLYARLRQHLRSRAAADEPTAVLRV